MKQAWTDLKSFITVSMIVLLLIVIVANLFGFTLSDNLLVLVTNLVTAVFTYYFAKKDKTQLIDENNSESEEK